MLVIRLIEQGKNRARVDDDRVHSPKPRISSASIYHRLVIRFGGYRNPAAKKRAIVAIAHTLIVIIWQLLTTSHAYTDLGADFYARRNDPEREIRRLLARLEALGHKVTLAPAA